MRKDVPNTPTTPRSAGSGGAWPLALAALIVLLSGPAMLLAYAIADWEFVRGSLRVLQGLALLALGALAVGLFGAVVVGVAGLWTRWASPRARKASTKVAIARAAWPELPDDAKVTLAIGETGRHREPAVRAEVIEPAIPALVEPSPQLPAPAPPVGQVLKALERQGRICRSGNSLMVGDDASGTPVYIELADACLIALGGAPQTGKTSLSLFLIAQAAMMGWGLFICDPHGRHERGIISRGAPLSGAFTHQAIEQHEISAAISAFDALGRARINGDPDRTPAFLVIDEFPALTLGGELGPREMEQLIRIGSQYPKVGLYIIAIGYEWSAQLFASRYGAPLRNLSRHRAVAQCDARSAAFLVSERLAPQAAQLQRGEVFFLGRGAYGVLRVPLIGHEDMVYAAGGTPPQPYVPAPAPAEEPAIIDALAEPQTLDERIVALLAQASAPMGSRAIIDALGEDDQQVFNALGRLFEAGRVSRSGSRRAYLYQLTHTQAPPSGA